MKTERADRGHPGSERTSQTHDPLTLDTPWISGACFAITPRLFRETKGFDERIFMYCEDVDLSWRARLLGFKTKICPTAWFFHDTVNRRPNPILEFQMLLSGRYLGAKWGVPEFRETMERLILEKGLISDLGALPSLDGVPWIDESEKVRHRGFQPSFSFFTCTMELIAGYEERE